MTQAELPKRSYRIEITQAELPDWNDPSGATGLESPKRSYRIEITQAELPD